MLKEVLTYFVSFFNQDLPQEAASHVPKNAPPKEWPSEGLIKFDQVSLRYRPDQPQVCMQNV